MTFGIQCAKTPLCEQLWLTKLEAIQNGDTISLQSQLKSYQQQVFHAGGAMARVGEAADAWEDFEQVVR